MKIRELRERAGMTKTDLARAMGVDLSAVSKWESGVNKPTADRLLELSELFHCTIDELFNRDPPGRDSA